MQQNGCGQSGTFRGPRCRLVLGCETLGWRSRRCGFLRLAARLNIGSVPVRFFRRLSAGWVVGCRGSRQAALALAVGCRFCRWLNLLAVSSWRRNPVSDLLASLLAHIHE